MCDCSPERLAFSQQLPRSSESGTRGRGTPDRNTSFACKPCGVYNPPVLVPNMELHEVVRLLTAPDAQVTWHEAYFNRNAKRGEFFQVRSGKHWVMLSVSNVRPRPPETWRNIDWDDPNFAKELEELMKKL